MAFRIQRLMWGRVAVLMKQNLTFSLFNATNLRKDNTL